MIAEHRKQRPGNETLRTQVDLWMGNYHTDKAAKEAAAEAAAEVGDAKSSLGDAKSSLGDAKTSLGDAKTSLGDANRTRRRLISTSRSTSSPTSPGRWSLAPRRVRRGCYRWWMEFHPSDGSSPRRTWRFPWPWCCLSSSPRRSSNPTR